MGEPDSGERHAGWARRDGPLSGSRTVLSCVLIIGCREASCSLLRYDLSLLELGQQLLGMDLKGRKRLRRHGRGCHQVTKRVKIGAVLHQAKAEVGSRR